MGQTIKDEKRGDFTGFATDINGEGAIIAIGSPFADNKVLGCGKVDVYQFHTQKWIPLGKPLYGNMQGGHFGSIVDLNKKGNILAVGAPNNNKLGINSGKVSVFEWKNDQWQRLGEDFIGKRAYDKLGTHISLSDDGRTLAIGTPSNPKVENDQGKIEVFAFDDTMGWIPLGNTIIGETYVSRRQYSTTISSETQHIGEVFDLSGDGKTLILGSSKSTLISDNSYMNGNLREECSVAVFRLQNGLWQKLGDILFPEQEYEIGFGEWVSTNEDGSLIALGSHLTQEYKYVDDSKDLFSGYIKTYRLNDSGKWQQVGNKLQGEGGDTFGVRFSLNGKGNKMAVTGHGYNPDDGPANMNYAYYFELNDTVWCMNANKIKLKKAWEDYTVDISLSHEGDTFIVGNSNMDNDGLTFGEVTVYKPKK
ncbi:hypothetical protein [Costertonia aggregata]|uniref:Uncharacterized protein n=1 Tax=Costertonia aggregata TaxID=343403 RepID=A0A7H9AQ36_9FLAO|nr:hypothetical protein [Costertonia aggregata]QLG45513.1 hypothetical protein HYG79_09190 [Costertonia aggregata]